MKCITGDFQQQLQQQKDDVEQQIWSLQQEMRQHHQFFRDWRHRLAASRRLAEAEAELQLAANRLRRLELAIMMMAFFFFFFFFFFFAMR